jgi:phage terminase small subunit
MPRIPLSEAEHRENGTYEKNKHEEREVHLQDFDGTFPGHLLPAAAKPVWLDLCHQLSEETLAAADTPLLIEYCRLTLIMQEAYHQWTADIRDKDAMRAYTTAMDRVVKLSGLFGMHPLSRRQIRIKVERKKKSPLDLLRRGLE